MRDDGPQIDYQMITAFFDKKEDAERAVERLEGKGISRHDIQLVAGRNLEASTEQQADDDKGFFETLKDWFIPEEDRESYSEGLRRGGYVVRVDTDLTHREQVFDILDDDGTVDMAEREREWRSGGWTGTTEASEHIDRKGRRDDEHGRKRVRSYVMDDHRRAGTNEQGHHERDLDHDDEKPQDPLSSPTRL